MTLSIAVFVLTALALAAWLKHVVTSAATRRYRARIFLTVLSAEREQSHGIDLPLSTSHFYRDINLPGLPAPGTELDGLGTGPLQLSRVVVEPESSFDCFIQLAPVDVVKDNMESFTTGLTELGWKSLPMTPPYPWQGPNNSFKPKPLRGSA